MVTIVNESCYFCENKETVLFNEHYTFCPNCSAIYTVLMVLESNCEHIKDGIPLVERLPWFTELSKSKPYIREKKKYGFEGIQVCSQCGQVCIADGW